MIQEIYQRGPIACGVAVNQSHLVLWRAANSHWPVLQPKSAYFCAPKFEAFAKILISKLTLNRFRPLKLNLNPKMSKTAETTINRDSTVLRIWQVEAH